jgi:hypothetical protein
MHMYMQHTNLEGEGGAEIPPLGHICKKKLPMVGLTLGACVRVTVVFLSVCVSVTILTATYLTYESQVRCYKVPYGVPNARIV